MSQNQIVARYSFAHEAHIAKIKLESAGIEAFISDEHLINADWLYSDLLGGVKLWVASENVVAAQEVLQADYSIDLEKILEEEEPWKEDADLVFTNVLRCIDCNSDNIETTSSYFEAKFQCNNCDKRWSYSKNRWPFLVILLSQPVLTLFFILLFIAIAAINYFI